MKRLQKYMTSELSISSLYLHSVQKLPGTINKLECYVHPTAKTSHEVYDMAFLLKSTNTQRREGLKNEKTDRVFTDVDIGEKIYCRHC